MITMKAGDHTHEAQPLRCDSLILKKFAVAVLAAATAFTEIRAMLRCSAAVVDD